MAISQGSYSIVKNNKGIIDELKSIDIPDYVKGRANIIWNSLDDTTVKGYNRLKLIHACIYVVYVNEHIAFSEEELASKIGVSKNDLISGIALLKKKDPNNLIHIEERNVQSFIANYLTNLNILHYYDYVLEIYNSVKDKKQIKELSPQTCAAGIIKYFYFVNSFEINSQTLESACDRKNSTITHSFNVIRDEMEKINKNI